MNTAKEVVTTVRTEHSHGLRKRDCRRRCASGDASIGSRWEVNGIIVAFGSGEPCDGSDRQVLEFLERGVELPVSRRMSKLVPVLATSGRGFSGVSRAPGP